MPEYGLILLADSIAPAAAVKADCQPNQLKLWDFDELMAFGKIFAVAAESF